MYAILRQAVGVVIGGLIVMAITLAPHASANDQITVASVQAPVTIDESSATGKSMTYQGMLLDANGNPVANGFYDMVFSIYNTPDGNQPLWTQEFKEDPTQNPPLKGVQVTNGLFTVLLPIGKNGDAETDIFTGQDVWLGVHVGADAEATPRQPLLFVPYAVMAGNARRLDSKGSNYLPLAFGIIDYDGNIETGSGNFSSDWRNESDRLYYEIAIDGESYDLNRFVTVVTPISQKRCVTDNDLMAAFTNSEGEEGKLIVELRDRDLNPMQCKFHFVTFKP